MTGNVEDCALLLEAIAGPDPQDIGMSSFTLPPIRERFTGDLRGVKLGVVRHFWEEDLDVSAELARAADAAIEVLRSLGATVETVRLRPLHEYYAVRLMLTESELYRLAPAAVAGTRAGLRPSLPVALSSRLSLHRRGLHLGTAPAAAHH